MEVGTQVWVLRDRRWRLAVITETTNEGITCKRVEAGEEDEEEPLFRVMGVDTLTQVQICNPREQRLAGVDDLTSLVHLHEPAILHALEVRFAKQQIYTSTGSILVAVNPFQPLALYEDAIMRRYMEHGRRQAQGEKQSPLEPHVYSVADKAFRDMNADRSTNPNQSILVSGESGAGKTETTKILMTYLASVSAATTHALDVSVRNRVLESNPILEAFGNAKTTRNNNSSRFGKFIRLGFDKAGLLRGASISTYLLERVRLVSQMPGERNYHIFYELLRGASPATLESLHLGSMETFNYLNQSGCYTREDGVDDGEQFKKTIHAMTTLGIDQNAQDSVLQLVAAILHLGNVQFTKKGQESSQFSNGNGDAAVAVSKLLGISVEAIEKSMTTRRIKAGADSVVVGLTVPLAEVARDVVAKTIYSRVFDWLVERINVAIETNASDRFIGVVDIFGFEIFEKNSLEQLCINFANEKLQQLFAKFVFEMEQQEYANEDLPWTFVDYPNNDACVALFESRPIGVFSLLDEQCVVPRGNDVQFAAKLYDSFTSHQSFSGTKLHQGKSQFVINHYAGTVLYCTSGFCDKNKDSVHPEAIDLLVTSSLPFVKSLFVGEKAVPVPPRTAGGRSGSRPGAASSVVMKFKTQLNLLLDLLNATVPHFIRCIKPNDTLHPHEFDAIRVVEQLRCSGVLEAVKISRAGFPIRMPHANFQHLVRGLVPSCASEDIHSQAQKLASLDDLRAYPQPFQVGRTKVFMIQAAYEHLNRLQVVLHAKAVRTIQRTTRGWLIRRRVQKMKLAIVRLQSWVRVLQAKKALLLLKKSAKEIIAAKKIQTQYRRHKCRHHFLQLTCAVALLQRTIRGFLGRRRASRRRVLVEKAARAAALVEAARLAEEAREAARQAEAAKLAAAAASVPQIQKQPSASSMQKTPTKILAPLQPIKKEASIPIDPVKPGDPVRQISFEEFSDSDEDEIPTSTSPTDSTSSPRSTVPTDSSNSPRSTIPKFREAEYEINWECGMLGLYFESDDQSGLPIVRRVHETLSTCADIFDVSPGDVLLSVGGKRVANNDIRHILKLLQEVQKPVSLRFQRTNRSMRESTALMMDEYEVLWRDSIPLGLGFKPDKKRGMPCVSKCRGNPQIPGMFNVRLGDYLTAINEISTYKIEFSRVITLLEEGPRPVVLRFQRADPEEVDRDTHLSNGSDPRMSMASVRESVHRNRGESVRFSERDSMALSRLSVMSLNPKLDDSLYNITWKEEDGALGIVVKQAISSFYPEVTKVKPEGAILRQPNKVSVGDLLVSINNNNISKMGFRNAMHLLQIGPKPVLLTFQKSERTSHVGVPASI